MALRKYPTTAKPKKTQELCPDGPSSRKLPILQILQEAKYPPKPRVFGRLPAKCPDVRLFTSLNVGVFGMAFGRCSLELVGEACLPWLNSGSYVIRGRDKHQKPISSSHQSESGTKWVWVKIKRAGYGRQILVHVSIYQGKPFWAPIFDPQPNLLSLHHVFLPPPSSWPNAQCGTGGTPRMLTPTPRINRAFKDRPL